jgi:hypothetical protein
MKLTVDLADATLEGAAGGYNGVMEAHDVLDARKELINRDRRPAFLFSPPQYVNDLYMDSTATEYIVSVETILRNPFVTDFEEAVELFEEYCHPDAEMMLFGMHVIETNEIDDPALFPATDGGIPDTEMGIKIDP